MGMLEIGTLVDGKYKILNKVGQGGMSVVYLAMNEKANKQWAIKEVRKDGVKDFEGGETKPCCGNGHAEKLEPSESAQYRGCDRG